MIIQASLRDLGGFQVRRALPTAQLRTVGPFVFFDEMGPVEFEIDQGMDVRAHPHIGLSTLTYLYSGEVLHRDTLGVEQVIRPGEVNWMTAGSGVAHSERSLRNTHSHLHGVQVWLALPKEKEEIAPSFHHFSRAEIPEISLDGTRTRIIAGSFLNVSSPVPLHSAATYLDVHLGTNSELRFPRHEQELAVYVLRGQPQLNGMNLGAGQLALVSGSEVHFRSSAESHVLILGGKPLPERRHVWWNFVSTSRERIERAKKDWQEQRFGKIKNETDWIPLPT